ncbi:MAG: choice-of-anchor D domain-containing protein, partial [Candidatus Kapaibacterium sp.]
IYLRLFISSAYETDVVIGGPMLTDKTYHVRPDEVTIITVDPTIENRTSERVLPKGVEITSELPVSVYCYNSMYTTSDSYSAIPVSRWGTRHVIMSMPNDQYYLNRPGPIIDSTTLTEPRRSEFMVMAAYDNTTIRFQPKAMTEGAKQTYEEYTEVLNTGDTYLVKSHKGARGTGDLSGTIVYSDKPVGVISGHMRTAVPQNLPYPFDSKDHIVEQLPPVKSWGTRFVSLPFSVNGKGDFFKLTSYYPFTYVRMYKASGDDEIALNGAGWTATRSYINEPVLWVSNNPVQIGQMMMHSGDEADNLEFDPCLVLLPPVEQFVSRILFLTPENFARADQYVGHGVLLVADAASLPTLRFDGKLMTGFTPIANNNIINTDLYWAHLNVIPGQHEITSTTGKFSGIIYGYGLRDSYATALGSSLNIPGVKDTIKPEIHATVDCGRIEGYIRETADTINTGLNFIRIIKENTYNYIYEFDEVTDTSTFVTFRAWPDDPFADGRLNFEVYDNTSNKVSYDYQYTRRGLELPSEIRFDNISWHDSVCQSFTIKNNAPNPIYLESADYTGDPRVTIEYNRDAPLWLDPGEEISAWVCFTPKGDSTDMTANIAFAFECDINKEIAISGNVIAATIDVVGHDFGEVRIGETKCDSIYIINNGNVPMIVDSLLISQISDAIEFIPDGIFPVRLLPGEQIAVPVCFTPDSTGNYQSVAHADNSLKLSNTLTVSGNGIAPNINSIVVDWGPRRVGTVNPATRYLTNDGTDWTYVEFIQFTEQTHTDNNTQLIEGIGEIMHPGDSMRLDFVYIPQAREDYNIIAQLSTDWPLHEALSIELHGRGTLPAIEVFDIRCDTTVVFTSSDKRGIILKTGGNEALTIDSVYIAGGDTGSFEFDTDSFKNVQIKPDSSVYLDVRFVPETIGEHSVRLSIVHDAMPDYQRATDEVVISGYAIPGDTVSVDSRLETPPSIISCHEATLEAVYENTGNVDLELQSLTFDSPGGTAEWIAAPALPQALPVDSALRYPIRVFATRGQTDNLRIDAIISDTISRTMEYAVDPLSFAMRINPVADMEVAPGDTTMLTLSGSYPDAVDQAVEFVLRLKVDYKFFHLMNESGNIIISDGTSETQLAATLVQHPGEIEVRTAEMVDLSGGLDWSVTIPLMILLAEDPSENAAIEVMSDACFDPGNANFEAKINDVCIFNLRSVKLITNLPKLKIAPNPVTDELNIEVYLPEEDKVDIELIGMDGKLFTLKSNLNLKKGKHSLIFETGMLPTGAYIVSLKTTKTIRNSLILISK